MQRALVRSLFVGLVSFSFVATTAAETRVRGTHPRIQRVAPAAPVDTDDGYFSDYVTGPLGSKTPVMDVPGSTTVITRKMMDDFQSRSLCDALRLAPGVTGGGC